MLYLTIGNFCLGQLVKDALKLTDHLEIWDKPNTVKVGSFNSLILPNLQAKYNTLWVHYINNFQTKLRSYCTFKTKWT